MNEHGGADSRRTVVIVGAGGNIGSHLVPLVGRMSDVSRVVLVDPDSYTEANLSGQSIAGRDVGLAKAAVQKRRLHAIAPRLQVSAMSERVEAVPRARLQGDVLLACLDSRVSRQAVNQIAWRLGMPWIDAGVDAHFGMARVSVFFPGEESACLECGWSDRDYELLEQIHSCGAEPTIPTAAPAELGALAAALQATACRNVLSGERGSAGGGYEVTLSTASHRMRSVSLRRNPACRLADHGVWSISELSTPAVNLTVRTALDLGRAASPHRADSHLEIENAVFVAGLRCPDCGHRDEVTRIDTRVSAKRTGCPSCGSGMDFNGGDVLETVGGDDAERATSTLADLGLRDGDVVTIVSGNERKHFALGTGRR